MERVHVLLCQDFDNLVERKKERWVVVDTSLEDYHQLEFIHC
jgi:hypothetical protein